MVEDESVSLDLSVNDLGVLVNLKLAFTGGCKLQYSSLWFVELHKSLSGLEIAKRFGHVCKPVRCDIQTQNFLWYFGRGVWFLFSQIWNYG